MYSKHGKDWEYRGQNLLRCCFGNLTEVLSKVFWLKYMFKQQTRSQTNNVALVSKIYFNFIILVLFSFFFAQGTFPIYAEWFEKIWKSFWVSLHTIKIND